MLGDKWIYLSLTRRQAITWTNADLLPIFDPQEYIPVKFESKQKIFHGNDSFENIVSKISGILSTTLCVNGKVE